MRREYSVTVLDGADLKTDAGRLHLMSDEAIYEFKGAK